MVKFIRKKGVERHFDGMLTLLLTSDYGINILNRIITEIYFFFSFLFSTGKNIHDYLSLYYITHYLPKKKAATGSIPEPKNHHTPPCSQESKSHHL
jgi:hypothetical protein